jgi:hypothetical protein
MAVTMTGSLVNTGQRRYFQIGTWKMATIDLVLSGTYDSTNKVTGLDALVQPFGWQEVFQLQSFPRYSTTGSATLYLRFNPGRKRITVHVIDPASTSTSQEGNEVANAANVSATYRCVIWGR